jgi:MoaA/NifB/PqqE/SkfB family radical SAM enzyme
MCYGHSPLLKQNLWRKEQQIGTKDMDFETFQLVFNRFPQVKHLTFSGWGEPLVNPDVFKMVFLAHTSRKAHCHLITNGLLLEARMEEILASPLRKLTISLNGFSPKSYERLTGMDGQNFEAIQKQTRLLLKQKQLQNQLLPIWLSVLVDVDGVSDLPIILEMAEKLGVNGLQLVNYQDADPKQLSERTLTHQHQDLLAQINQLKQASYPFEVEWPVILSPLPSTQRACKDPVTTVAVDGDCNVSACSRWLLFDGRMGKVWDADVWHNEKISWLRNTHNAKSQDDLPRPCQYCPNNTSCG